MSIESDPFNVSKQSVTRGLILASGKSPVSGVPKAPKTAKKVLRAWDSGKAGKGPGPGARSHNRMSDLLPFKKSADADPFELSKAKPQESTTGRKATAALAPGIHGIAAAKKGKRARAAGNEYGGAVLGSLGGSVAGGVLSGGRAGGAALGSAVGSVGGAIAGNNRNQRKGYLKGRG
jgi:hypothetical protein